MLAHETPPRSVSPATFDQRVILHGITWDQYEAVLAMRGESSGVRIAYFRGELELMSPSRDHESIKTGIARLVEAYAEERGLRLDGSGSMTRKSGASSRTNATRSMTGGGLDKLEICRAFGVREVGFGATATSKYTGWGTRDIGES